MLITPQFALQLSAKKSREICIICIDSALDFIRIYLQRNSKFHSCFKAKR